jgi:uncharacterized membrane protein YjgN (DUF898 family)
VLGGPYISTQSQTPVELWLDLQINSVHARFEHHCEPLHVSQNDLEMLVADPAFAPVPEQPRAERPDLHRFAFHGTGGALFALVLKNMLLTLLTLGVYVPWAKTARRTFVWQNIEIAGHRLRYQGTGRELFFGYLKLASFYVAFYFTSLAVRRLFGDSAVAGVQIGMALLIVPFVPFVIWSSRRYLLSRTSWRGVPFRLTDGARAFTKTFFTGLLLTVVTLGLYSPVLGNRLYRVFMSHTGLGTKLFEYRGDDRAVFKIGLKGILLTLVTFGIYSFWYNAEIARYRAQHTWFDGAHGEIKLTGFDLFALTFLQIFGLTCTLGLAFPWITTYTLRFMLERLQFVGPIDYAHIYSAPSEGNAVADGLADALDVGAAL